MFPALVLAALLQVASPAAASQVRFAAAHIAVLQVAVSLQQAPRDQARALDLDQLQRLAPNFDWRAFFRELGSPVQVLRLSPAYLQALNGLLLALPLASWQSYLRWLWLQ